MKNTINTRPGRWLLLAVILPLGSLFGEQGQLILRVFEDATQVALEGATVQIDSLDLTRATDASGRVIICDLPAGSYDVTVRYRGLPDTTQTVEVAAGEPTALPIRMGVDEEIFELTAFVDVFDAGPIIEARLADLPTARASRRPERVEVGASGAVTHSGILFAPELDFRAVLAVEARDAPGVIHLSDQQAASLSSLDADRLRYYPFNAA